MLRVVVEGLPTGASIARDLPRATPVGERHVTQDVVRAVAIQVTNHHLIQAVAHVGIQNVPWGFARSRHQPLPVLKRDYIGDATTVEYTEPQLAEWFRRALQ